MGAHLGGRPFSLHVRVPAIRPDYLALGLSRDRLAVAILRLLFFPLLLCAPLALQRHVPRTPALVAATCPVFCFCLLHDRRIRPGGAIRLGGRVPRLGRRRFLIRGSRSLPVATAATPAIIHHLVAGARS